ncbi:MAG: hypothetical protein ACE5I1_10025 [bacterium]
MKNSTGKGLNGDVSCIVEHPESVFGRSILLVDDLLIPARPLMNAPAP